MTAITTARGARRRRLIGSLVAAFLPALWAGSLQAQVVLDGTLGGAGALPGPNYGITADLGLTRGNNLFHSFAQFDLKAGDVATFSGPAHIRNILSRVTGGSPSSIDGTLRSDIAGGNLFFINPSGVVFGPNAVVDVSGAFAASTANYLKLADGARFVAALDADDSTLSTEPVVAFGFLEGAAGGIEVRGTLKVAPETALSVVGGTVSVADGAHLEAINGRIDLVGVSSPGEVPVPPSPLRVGGNGNGGGANPTSGGGVVIRGGRLVVDQAQINVSTTGGDVDIRLTESLQVIRGGQITTTSTDTSKGGNIVIEAPAVILDGLDEPVPTRIAAETFSGNAEAAGGDIVIHSDSVELRLGAEISVSSFGAADAGLLEITTSSLLLQSLLDFPLPTQISANASPTIGATAGAGGRIVLRADVIGIENGAGILAATTGDARAGSIDIQAKSLALRNGGVTTFTAGAGEGGEIRVLADQVILDGPFASITALTSGLNDRSPAGNGGVINITAGDLQLLNDAGISANTYGDARGGNVNITAGSVLLDTATFEPGSLPGITAASNPSFFGTGGGGKGGDLTVVADSLTLRNGMQISTTTFTTGDGGSINLTAGTVALDARSSIQSASLGPGRAGTLSLQASQNVLLTGNSTVSTSAPESSGGDIRVQAGDAIRVIDSRITAQAGPGGGGNISLLAPSLIYLLDGTITAQAVGDGGNLTIDPVFFILNRSGLISRSSSANGGNITILSDYFFRSASLIDASAPFGLPGTVQVSAPDVDLSGSLIGLPGNLLDVESQLRPDCAVRLTDDFSSFVVLGRGGLPIAPGGFVPSGGAPPWHEKP